MNVDKKSKHNRVMFTKCNGSDVNHYCVTVRILISVEGDISTIVCFINVIDDKFT